MAEAFLGEIKLISWNYAPQGWAFCNGQFLLISQNQALFSLLGTVYGGNGQTTFALPDLRGRAPLHVKNQEYTMGQVGGENSHTLTAPELPQHRHRMLADAATPASNNAFTPAANNSIGQTVGDPSQGSPFSVNIYSDKAANALMAPGSVSSTGGNQPHENRQPFLVLNFIIALQGVFPSRN